MDRDITEARNGTQAQLHFFLHHHTPTSRHSPLDAPFCSSRLVIIQPLHHVSLCGMTAIREYSPPPLPLLLVLPTDFLEQGF